MLLGLFRCFLTTVILKGEAILCHRLTIHFYVVSTLHPFHRLLCSALSVLSDEIFYMDKHALLVHVCVEVRG